MELKLRGYAFISLLYVVLAADVILEIDKTCYDIGDTMTLTATYNGSFPVVTVEWVYSGKLQNNFIVIASTCGVFGGSSSIDAGYPDDMQYKCYTTDSTLADNSFVLIVPNLNSTELDNKVWGATFSLTGASQPSVVEVNIKQCEGPTTTTTTTTSSTTTYSTVPTVTSTTTSTTTSNNTSDNTGIIIGACAGSFALLAFLCICILVCYWCRRKANNRKKEIYKAESDIVMPYNTGCRREYVLE